ncbi:hypothetical protein YC2023_020541 [Brassica napus]
MSLRYKDSLIVSEMEKQLIKQIGERTNKKGSLRPEVKIDLDFQRELFKKASEEKRLLEGELQKEASDKLRLRISRDRYAAEVKEAAEQLAKVRSELREVQIDLNLHRELLKKATEKPNELFKVLTYISSVSNESNQGGAAGHGIREHEEFIHSRLWETHEVMMTYKTDLKTPVAIEHITKD